VEIVDSIRMKSIRLHCKRFMHCVNNINLLLVDYGYGFICKIIRTIIGSNGHSDVSIDFSHIC
jgi:hypothetical protein